MNRIEALAAVVREEGADALLLTGEVNLIYATKITGLEGQCVILADGRAVFVTDGRYTEAAEQALIPQGFTVKIRIDTYDGEVVATKAAETDASELAVDLSKAITGKHAVYFEFTTEDNDKRAVFDLFIP